MGLSFNNEHFRHALRTTITIVIPVCVLFCLGYPNHAIATGLGALSVALSDVPADLRHKFRALLSSSILLAVITCVTGLLLPFPIALGLFLAVCCFGFSLLSIYGGGVTSVLNVALIMIIFTIGLKPANTLHFSMEILCGGLWYTASATVYTYFFPYRHIRQELDECKAEIAAFLETKACFYDSGIPLETCYRRMIPGHLRVSEKQEKVRAILLRESVLLTRSNEQAGVLLHQATELIDLYEQVLSIHQDYGFIRDALKELGILHVVHQLIRIQAAQLRKPTPQHAARFNALILQLSVTGQQCTGAPQQLISRLLDNFSAIEASILTTQNPDALPVKQSIQTQDAMRFAGTQSFHISQLLQQLKFKSPVFRFALRLTLCCLAAYAAMQLWIPGPYNYWLLLTIIIVARPSFSITRKRNFQRLIGSLVGVGLAGLVLQLVTAPALQLLILIACLFGYLAYLYINYQVSVVFITIVAITGLALLGGVHQQLLWQRALDSLLGCAIAVAACFLFPFWESRKIKDQVMDMLAANINYLEQLRGLTLTGNLDLVDYKLARKRLFNSAANLSRTYEHLLMEPLKNKFDHHLLYQFQVANHQLYGAMASFFQNNSTTTHERELQLQYADQAITSLSHGLQTLKAGTDTETIATDKHSETEQTSHFINVIARTISVQSIALAKNV